ncbi:MAG: hypothetical protein WAV13_07960, partial [Thermodesulfovibrionales bacterium]
MSNNDKTPLPPDSLNDPVSLRRYIAELEKKLTEQKKLWELAYLQRTITESESNEKILRHQIELIKLISDVSTSFVRAAA